ncbi:hypothetical protein [Methylovulum psychrotolerans]|uniref:hypothetical protein n=1 Tax=Methylovulum psychrotolerans TaxID=1704499 RepID=UPI0012FC1A3E|nr:hypothetical protein [Methylovulum psychrotolerans]
MMRYPTLFQEYPCAQAHLVKHGGHLFEELAVFGVDGGQHHDLVAGVDFGAAEPAVGVLGVFEGIADKPVAVAKP